MRTAMRAFALVVYANSGEVFAARPKGERDVAFMPEDASRFIEEAKRDGTVRRALDNAGLKSAPVAP